MMTGQTKHINGLINNMNNKNRCIKILRGLLKQENCRGEVSFAHIERAIKEIGDVKDASYTTYYCPSCGEDNEEKCLEIMSPGPYEWTCKNCDTKWIINIEYYIS